MSKSTARHEPERIRPWNSIRGRLGILTIVLMGVISTFILLFFPSQQKLQAERSAATTANSIADLTAYVLGETMRAGALQDADVTLDKALMLREVLFVVVLDQDGRVIAKRHQFSESGHRVADAGFVAGLSEAGELLTVRRDILANDNESLVGTVILGYSLEGLTEVIRSSRTLIVYISILVFIFGLAGVYAVSYVITEPLGQMARAAQRVSDGDFKVRVVSTSTDEVGVLARSFNEMVDSLQSAYASLENANATLAHHSEDLQVEVAERARVEKALRLSEGRFRAVVEYATDMVLITSTSGELRYVSPPCKQMLGYDASEMVGTDLASIIHPEDRAEFRSRISEAASGKTSDPRAGFVSVEVRCRHRGGFWRYLSLRGRNLQKQSGVEGILFNVSDISELKQYQQQLVDARDTAEKMVRLKDSFLANMSHEIRTPLTGILGFAQVLRQEVDADQLELVEYIQDGGTRLLNTLNSVLDLAQLEANALELQMEVVDLRDELADAVHLLEPLARVKQLSLEVDGTDEPAFVEVDRRCLFRIVNNLLTNAIKFTERGGIRAVINRRNSEVVLEIRDTGVGVSAEFLPSLFDEFKQESTGLSRTHEGSGLGLAITRRLVELHGGTITATSKKGRGSSFFVTLPVAAKPSELPKRNVVRTPDRKPVRPSRAPRILLVEDNADTRLLFSRILSSEFDLRVASTPSEAIQTGKMDRFDLVIMDISLGDEKDGVHVMRELRNTGNFDDVPFLAVTAYALPGDKVEFLAEGFHDYLAKPFRKEDLVEMVRRHLNAGIEQVAG